MNCPDIPNVDHFPVENSSVIVEFYFANITFVLHHGLTLVPLWYHRSLVSCGDTVVNLVVLANSPKKYQTHFRQWRR